MVDDTRPVASDMLYLPVIVLYPLFMGQHFPLDNLWVCWEIGWAHQVAQLDDHSAEEGQVVTSIWEANHPSEHICLIYLLRRIHQLFQAEFLGDRDETLKDACGFRVDRPIEI